MNTNLERNINAIKNYNEELADKILNLKAIHNKIRLCETAKKEPNLLFNEIPLHDNNGAEMEASNIFADSQDENEKIHVIYGLGIGYLFKEFATKAKGKVIIYEPELEILRVVFELVDFTKELMKKNVFITNTKQDLKECLYNLINAKTTMKLHFLSSYRQTQMPFIQALSEELGKIFSITKNNKKFEKENAVRFLENTLANFNNNLNATSLKELDNLFPNIPAIIVSAGPSLGKNIEKLKQLQDKAIIIAVGTAMKVLCKNGIKPDFLTIIEAYDCASQINDLDCSDINLIYEGYTNPIFQQFSYKNRFLSLSKEALSNVWLSQIFNDKYQKYETKGTVSYGALNAARIMCCSPIVLIGQDLAYTDGNCYSNNSIYSSLKCVFDEKTRKCNIVIENREEFDKAYFSSTNQYSDEIKEALIDIRLRYLNETVTFVKGQTANYLPTESGYAMFIECFKDFAQKYGSQTELINASIGGAQIDGFKNIPLDEIPQICSKKPNINDLLKQINLKSYNNLEEIKANLTNDKRNCEQLKSQLQQGLSHIKNCKNEFSRHKTLTLPLGKYIKNVINTYSAINESCRNNNDLVKILNLYESEIIHDKLKENTNWEQPDDIDNIIKSFEAYYGNILATVTKTISDIENIIKNL